MIGLGKTTILIKTETLERLRSVVPKGVSYDYALNKLLDFWLENGKGVIRREDKR